MYKLRKRIQAYFMQMQIEGYCQISAQFWGTLIPIVYIITNKACVYLYCLLACPYANKLLAHVHIRMHVSFFIQIYLHLVCTFAHAFFTWRLSVRHQSSCGKQQIPHASHHLIIMWISQLGEKHVSQLQQTNIMCLST